MHLGSFSNLIDQEAGVLAQDYISALRNDVKWEEIMGKLSATTTFHLRKSIQELEQVISQDLEHREHRLHLSTHSMGPITLVNTLRVLFEKAPRSLVQLPDGTAQWNAEVGDSSLWLPDNIPRLAEIEEEEEDKEENKEDDEDD